MFTSILLLMIPFLTIAFLPVAIKTSLSSNELMEMGVYLEDPEAPEPGEPFPDERIGSNLMVVCCNA